MHFFREKNLKSPHDNLFLNLPEYGSAERAEEIALLSSILQDWANTKLPDMSSYCKTSEQSQWFSAEFGEHYRLINSLTKSLKLRRVIEVGSFTGMSALVWLLNKVSLTSIDIVSWKDFEGSVLSDSVVGENLFNQKILNLLDDASFDLMCPEFLAANLIFLDGPKDGVFEQKVVPKLIDLLSGNGSWLLLDDIHLRAMKPCWEEIKNDKYDLSLIGHSSGTGLVKL